MQKAKLLFSYFFYLLLSCTILYFSGLQLLGELFITLFLYSIILYSLSWIWRSLRKKTFVQYKLFLENFLFYAAFWLSVFFILFGSFLVVQNNIFPAKLPLYIISNGEKTIYFQAMSHIGTKEFYTQVQSNILEAKKQNFVLFFEGVGPGSEENTKAFNQALGINFNKELYENFSQLYGVVAQDNNLFLGIENEKDYNIDLNLDEVMQLYYKKTGKTATQTKSKLPESEDISILITQVLKNISQEQLLILQYVNKSFLNFIIKHESLREAMIERFGNPDIFHVILEDRNKHLVSEIEKSSEERIFITYGLMHWKGVFELLKTQDARWEIQEVRWYTVISPARVSGRYIPVKNKLQKEEE